LKILETENLTISELNTGDAEFIRELLNDPDWIRFIGDRGVRTNQEAARYILAKHIKSYLKYGFGLYRVKLKNNDRPIGICGLIKRDGLVDIDIGFAFLPKFRRQGYAFESASAILKYSKEVLQIDRIVAITSLDNVNSEKLLNKLGLRFEKKIQLPNDDKESKLYVPA